MEDRSQGDLNEFLKSRLQNDRAADNGWNVPPIDVFHSVMSEVNRKPKNNRGFLYALALLIFLTGVLSSVYFVNKKIEHKDQAFNQLQEQLVELNEINKRQKEQLENIESKNSFSDEILAMEKTAGLSNGINITEDFQPETTKVFKTYNATKPEINLGEKVFSTRIVNKEQQLNPFKEELISVVDIQLNKLVALQEIRALYSSNVNHLSQTAEFSAQPEILQHKYKAEPLNKWALLSAINQNYTSIAMSNIVIGEGMNLVDYDNAYTSYGFSIGANYQINQTFGVHGNFGYNRYHNESNFTHRFNFDAQNETPNGDGSSMYETDLDVVTPMGTYSTRAAFSVDSDTYSSSDEFRNETYIQQNLNIISFGVGPSISFPISNRVNFVSRSGIHYNYITNFVNHFEAKMMMQGLELLSMEMSPKGEDMILSDAGYFSFTLNAGLEYQINHNVHIVLGSSFSRNIDALQLNAPALSSSIYLQNVGLNLGTKIHF